MLTRRNITTGRNAVVVQDEPNKAHPNVKYPKVETGERRTLLWMPFGDIRGKTVVSAIASVPSHGETPPQTITWQALDGKWHEDKVTWSGSKAQPGVWGLTAETELLAPVAGRERIEWDITALVQAIANGQPNHGWRISTDHGVGASFRGFGSGLETWEIALETSDAAVSPEDLSPAGVISVGRWVVRANDFDDLIAMQVQVDALADGADPDYDTGWVATVDPVMDLRVARPGGTHPGVLMPELANGDSTFWRARVRQEDGVDGDWSEWVEVTRVAKIDVVLVDPDAEIWDPSPQIRAEVVGDGEIVALRYAILDPADPTREFYNTGLIVPDGDPWTVYESQVSDITQSGRATMPHDGDYLFRFDFFDRDDRQASEGDPPYIRIERIATLDRDLAVTPPHGLTVVDTEDSPSVTLRWERVDGPDYFLIFRDGVQIRRVPQAEVRIAASPVWEWTDRGAAPNRRSLYTVRAVTDGLQSEDSETLEVFNDVVGFWILSEHGDIKLIGKDIDQITRKDKRATYNLPGRRDEVDIIGAFGGFSGPGTFELNGIRGDQDIDAARAALKKIKYDPETPVQIVMVDYTFPAKLRNIHNGPHRDSIPSRNLTRDVVSFECWQVGDFDDDGMPDA